MAGALPSLALVVGALCGASLGPPGVLALVMLPLLVALAAAAWWRGAPRGGLIAIGLGFWLSGLVLASHEHHLALHATLRDVLDREVGGFDLDRVEVPRPHPAMALRAVLVEDATAGDGFVTLKARARRVFVGRRWVAVDGGVTIAVGGTTAGVRREAWRAGRVIEAPVTFRRAARYLNDGVGDFERDLARDGTTLLASVKSGLLVEVLRPGAVLDEIAGKARARVRAAVERWVGLHGRVSAGVVNAVLIGDRAGLPADVIDRLQAAGTYHVIAISGGNVAILTGLLLVCVSLAGIRGRVGSALAMVVLLAYAAIVTAGPSVWRATAMAVTYLTARLWDQRAPPWQAVAVAAGVMAVAQPSDVSTVGFALTFGATLGLLHAGRFGLSLAERLVSPHSKAGVANATSLVRRALGWTLAAVVSTAAVELVLLPVAARAFSRVTAAGLLLNLVAIPAMGVAEVAGILVVLLPRAEVIAAPAGWVAHVAATSLVGSASLVDLAPWLTARVPPPSLVLVVVYYVALVGTYFLRAGGARACSLLMLAGSLVGIVTGRSPSAAGAAAASASLRWTIFDVGQGDGMLLEFPDGHRLMVDTGGAPFGSRAFDVGARVLAPALWARGVRSLDAVLLTHGDPDHVGGAPTLLEALDVGAVWEGVDVPGHALLRDLARLTRRLGIPRRSLRAGDTWTWGGVRVRVLYPPTPDWERVRVRNDDSVVLELLYGDVAVLLAGDVSADVEREIISSLTQAPIRLLKVAHHGSRTSTFRELLEAWRPQVAVISSGRGNTFGHPAADVVRRLEGTGSRVWRTDHDGQITLNIDGRQVRIGTFSGRVAVFPDG